MFYIFLYSQQQNNNRSQNQNYNRPINNPPNQAHLTNVPTISQPVSVPPTAPQNVIPAASTTSQEEIEFDEQFRKWEQEFDSWKTANINHPDKVAYRQYEQQFESVRQKLLQVGEENCKHRLFNNLMKLFIATS